jgi:FkbM family methyltransferase
MMFMPIKRLGRMVFALLILVLVSVIKRFPDKVLLRIRSGTRIVRKMDYQQHNIFLNIESEVENAIRLHSCEKEPETVEWIQTCFKEGDIFYDIGANVGAYSLVASKYFGGKIKVYAFEPGFATFPQLCKNIFLNDCQGSITPLQIALSDKTTIDVFNYNNLTPGGALHALGEPVDHKGDVFQPVFQQPVLSYRIDDLIEQFHIPVPDHIKIDVDGIELKILKGAEETLLNPSVNSLLLELEEGDEEANKIIEFLAYKGLKFHSKHRYVYGGDTGEFSRAYNYIFRRGI